MIEIWPGTAIPRSCAACNAPRATASLAQTSAVTPLAANAATAAAPSEALPWPSMISASSTAISIAAEAIPVALLAVAPVRSVPVAADQRDAPMAEAQQMLHRQRDPVTGIRADKIRIQSLNLPRNLHHRNAGSEKVIEAVAIRARHGANDDSVGTVLLEVLQNLRLPSRSSPQLPSMMARPLSATASTRVASISAK